MAETLLEDVDKIFELKELNDFMQDENLNEALEMVVKFSLKSDSIPPAKIPALIVKLQSLSAIFAVKATTYSTILRQPAGKPNNHKKNVYYTVNEALDRVVDALKYMSRYGS